LTGAFAANAQESFEEKYGKMITDDAAREAIRMALSKIQTAKCESNNPCASATAVNLKVLITNVDDRAAMVFSIKSALAQWCGIDWTQLPTYDRLRQGSDENE
jgi:hypothetical protein